MITTYERGDHVLLNPTAAAERRLDPWLTRFSGTVVTVDTFSAANGDIETVYEVKWAAKAGLCFDSDELLPAGPEHRPNILSILCPACRQIVETDLPLDPHARKAMTFKPGYHDCRHSSV